MTKTLITTLLFVFSVPTINAQMILDETFAPRPNDQWTVSYVGLAQTQVPVPLEGASLDYDLRFFADIDLGNFSSQTFATINRDSLQVAKYTIPLPNDSIAANERILLPTATGNPLMRELFVPAFTASNGSKELQFLDRRSDGIYLLATASFSPTVGIIDIDSIAVPPVIFPYEFSPGDTLRQTFYSLAKSQNTGIFPIRIDSTLHDLSITHLGLGSIRTFFGDYDNVSFVRHIERTTNYFFEQGSDIGTPSFFTIARVYAYAEEQYEPLAVFNYFPVSIDNPAPPNPAQDAVGIDFRIGDKLTRTRNIGNTLPLELSIFPNPARREINVHLAEHGPVQDARVTIRNNVGQVVLLLDSIDIPEGNLQLKLPASLVPGIYYVNVITKGLWGTEQVIID